MDEDIVLCPFCGLPESFHKPETNAEGEPILRCLPDHVVSMITFIVVIDGDDDSLEL